MRANLRNHKSDQRIVSIDPIYADFSMDELAARSYQRLIREGKLASSETANFRSIFSCSMKPDFLIRGTIDFSDNALERRLEFRYHLF